MDRHIVPGITLADATEAHNLDVAIQDDYDCKAITFWLDEERGCAFCLIEAPNQEAVKELHNDAHGLIPHEIVEVEENLVMAFLGRISDPKSESGLSTGSDAIFYDTAYRAIMVAHLFEAALIPSKYGKIRGQELFSIHSNIIGAAINRHNGREVCQTGDGYMASFASVEESVNCAVEIQKEFEKNDSKLDENLKVAIGVSSGDPVAGKDELFGEAIQLAKRLCYLSTGRKKILLSSEVMEKFGVNRLRILSQSIEVESLSPDEENFLNKLMNITEKTWDQPEFTLDNFCVRIGLSRSQLYRNITALTGQSFVDFIKDFRLKRALKLIEKDQDNITQAAFGSGLNNPSYFSKCFKERFGMLPSEFAKTIR